MPVMPSLPGLFRYKLRTGMLFVRIHMCEQKASTDLGGAEERLGLNTLPLTPPFSHRSILFKLYMVRHI